MRKTFAGLAILLALVVVAQFYFAAAGAFGSKPEAFRPHHVLGYVIFIMSVVVAVAGTLARVPGRLIGLAASIAALTSVQVLLGSLARSVGDDTTAGPLVFGLHGLTGLAILGIAGIVARRAWTLSKPAQDAIQASGSGVDTRVRSS